MREIASVEIHLAVEEIRPKIVDGFLKKFYELNNSSFRFGFRKGERNTMVYCKLLSTFNETALSESAGEPTQFAMGMRKRIEDCKVVSIEQHGSDRIIVLELSRHGDASGSHRIVIEMFGKGNIILLDSRDMIELCHTNMSFKDREIRPRAVYKFPKSEAIRVWLSKEEEISEAVASIKGKSKAMSELSKRIDIGPLYLEDIFNRAGINPKGKIENKEEIDRLAAHITEFLSAIKDPRPRKYSSDGKIVDYSIVPIKKYENSGYDIASYESVNLMLDALHAEERGETRNEGRLKRLAELNANVKKQDELAQQLKNDAEEYQKSGYKILNNMDEINSLIEYMRQNRRATLEELRSRFKGLRIKGLDLKNKTVAIEMDD